MSDAPHTMEIEVRATFAGNPSDILTEAAVGLMLDARPSEVRTLFEKGRIRGKRHWGGHWRCTYVAVLDYLESEVKP